MNIKNFSAVVLAAGKGKRMNNPAIAKVMALLCGKPLIEYVINSVSALKPDKIAIVTGHQGQSVIDYVNSLNQANIVFVEQKEQLGTGHAVAKAEPEFSSYTGDIIILAGDVPLITSETLEQFLTYHFSENADVTVLTADLPNPFGYGRIIRNHDNNFKKITEEKDANETEKKITEINSGIIAAKAPVLFSALRDVNNQNAQGEYYLTDIIGILAEKGKNVKAYKIEDYTEIQGVNSVIDLAEAERIINNK
jgi:bifunctional UDP-N-acetylglucosamine pyrophosphorylase / glucosamine-1-phosphate N-acetyltransferase